jgi:uncharacterized delta-60 repeat protein
VVIQPDGKVVLAGYVNTCVGSICNNDFLVVRFNTNGTLDSSFGTNGATATDVYSGQNEYAYAAAVQADGKIVVAGGAEGGVPSQTNIFGFKLVRYLPDGTLDGTFGTGGRIYESFDNMGGTPRSMLIQPDGKIVVAGADFNIETLFVARFNPDGSLDTGFGTNGKIISNVYRVYSVALARQADGKYDIAVFRPSTGAWYVLKSSDASVIGQQWGVSEDTPIPFVFVR